MKKKKHFTFKNESLMVHLLPSQGSTFHNLFSLLFFNICFLYCSSSSMFVFQPNFVFVKLFLHYVSSLFFIFFPSSQITQFRYAPPDLSYDSRYKTIHQQFVSRTKTFVTNHDLKHNVYK